MYHPDSTFRANVIVNTNSRSRRLGRSLSWSHETFEIRPVKNIQHSGFDRLRNGLRSPSNDFQWGCSDEQLRCAIATLGSRGGLFEYWIQVFLYYSCVIAQMCPIKRLVNLFHSQNEQIARGEFPLNRLPTPAPKLPCFCHNCNIMSWSVLLEINAFSGCEPRGFYSKLLLICEVGSTMFKNRSIA